MFLKQERPEIDDFEGCKFLILYATLGDSSKLFTVLCYHLKLNFRNLLRQHLRVFFCTFFRFFHFHNYTFKANMFAKVRVTI